MNHLISINLKLHSTMYNRHTIRILYILFTTYLLYISLEDLFEMDTTSGNIRITKSLAGLTSDTPYDILVCP